jgi:3',5'-cyclic AMP phosphodiesterase CpdA
LDVTLKIAVLGDPHFAYANGAQSHDPHTKLLIKEGAEHTPLMWSKLKELVQSKKLKADLLVSPGDITTRADANALEYGWKAIQELAAELSASLVAAATGNHDILSRLPESSHIENRPVRDKALKMLSPPYPMYPTDAPDLTSDALNKQINYFGTALTQHLGEHFRVVSLNTCSNHTHAKFDQEHGLFCESTLRYVEHVLGKQSRKINILLCHHRPTPDSRHDGKNHDFIDNFTILEDELRHLGRWIFIHGHKHVGRLSYGSSEAITQAPIILSAASLGANTATERATDTFPNQFYVMTVTHEESTERMLGELRVFEWHDSTREWNENFDMESPLSSHDGFGGSSPTLARDILAHLSTQDSGKWADVEAHFADLRYLTRRERDDLLKKLRQDGLIAVETDERMRRIERWMKILS